MYVIFLFLQLNVHIAQWSNLDFDDELCYYVHRFSPEFGNNIRISPKFKIIIMSITSRYRWMMRNLIKYWLYNITYSEI